MSFKDDVAEDIENVFLDLDEFAEEIRVEGKTISAVVDHSRKVGMKEGRLLGLVEADMIIHARATDFPGRMSPGRPIEVDGKEMILVEYAEDMGMAEVAVRQSRR